MRCSPFSLRGGGLIVRVLYFPFYSQRFLQRFIDPTSSEDENAGLDLNEPLYMQKLEEVAHRLWPRCVLSLCVTL